MFSAASYNPVGSYVREFNLEEGLLGKRVIICFEGVEQAMYVWLNGHFVGYAEDSFTPSEFDLTPYVKDKENRLAVEVHKRSTAAFLEDQDFFRFFGIFRNVSLYGKPRVHLEDLWVKQALCENGNGCIAIDFKVSADLTADVEKNIGWAEITLKDGSGRECLNDRLSISRDGSRTDEGYFRVKMEEKSIENVKVWDNENPSLYDLTVKLYDESGSLTEAVPYPVGFRKVEIKDKIIYLNGKRLIINGVNRHEWSAKTGRCIGEKEMEQDMEIILRNHINAVRTCHYPDQIPWYYLCDEKGIYLMAETNLESHGSWQKMGEVEPSWNVPGSLKKWREAVLDRARSNFELFKNHVSILFWSLGNESYAGDNLKEMNAFFKEKQDGRLVHYEGVFHNREYEDTISDVESRMYAPPEQIREYLEKEPKKPFILCEYMHDMGNSLGGMASYIRLLDEFEMYQGGFIWDFIDQALWVKDEVTGQKVLRYGGDFDDRPSDYEFSGNGIVFADRTEKPAMQEVRYYYGTCK
ncbi:beta-galactosidase large subunit [Muribaculaceae bacterium]|nr:beta-galactosidase large subunit [Muribaculaceae bacterium]